MSISESEARGWVNMFGLTAARDLCEAMDQDSVAEDRDLSVGELRDLLLSAWCHGHKGTKDLDADECVARIVDGGEIYQAESVNELQTELAGRTASREPNS